MNREDPFESRLSRPPMRKIPGAWREEILSAARAAQPARHPSPDADGFAWWRELFAPSPRAWGALAAAWVLILGLNLAARDTSSAVPAGNDARPTRYWQEALRQQRQVFAELAGLNDAPVADRPRSFVPRPRSAGRPETVSV